MHILKTEIKINAPAQTVWSILDDIERYAEWNPLIPEISGRTTVDQVLKIRLVQPGLPDLYLTPLLVTIVGGRQLRWLTALPDPTQLSGDHSFVLTPTGAESCHLAHNETFTGSLVESMWPAIDSIARDAYRAMNEALKQRAEHAYANDVLIHPAISAGSEQGDASYSETTLRCHCATEPVAVVVSEAFQHNHLCGCSRCWRPAGALFAQIAVVSKGRAKVLGSEKKLKVVDTEQSIHRYACQQCGVHMVGRVENPDHHFYGLEFIHPELSDNGRPPRLEFAAFTSSLVESGTSPSSMSAIRRRLAARDIPCYDSFSPELMDIIAWHKIKLAKQTAN